MLRPIMSETSKTAKIILVLYWGLGYNMSHIRSMAQYSTKMIFAVLDVSLIMGLNIGETNKVFFTFIGHLGDKDRVYEYSVPYLCCEPLE